MVITPLTNKGLLTSIQLIFTVSPVRHSKDGLIENNRSKARLFELITNLESSHSIHYFPSYEIVIDELRDYRFYTEDLVHPNSLAINYIWEIISSSLLSAEAQKIATDVEKLRLFAQHKIQTPIEEEKLIFESNRNLKIQQFLEKYPFVQW